MSKDKQLGYQKLADIKDHFISTLEKAELIVRPPGFPSLKEFFIRKERK